MKCISTAAIALVFVAVPSIDSPHAAGVASLLPSASQTPESNIVTVRAIGLTFEAPDRIPSGWTTFRLQNESAMTHFAVIVRMPKGRGVKEHQAQLAPVFQAGMNLLNAGKTEEAMQKFKQLPAWFGEVVFLGGPGLIGPAQTAQTTLRLDPGTYVLECYVKTDGVFHSFNPMPGVMGMVHELVVTDESNGASGPDLDVTVSISSEDGFEVKGNLKTGSQTIAAR